VVRTVGEIHFVADFGSKAEYTGERFDTARGVKHAIEVSVRQDCGEIGERHGAGRDSEADESTLERSIDPPGAPFAESKLWAEQKMCSPEVCANGIRQTSNRDMGRLFEVVSAFGLKDNVRLHVDGDTPAYAQHIEIVGVVKAEVIGKDADLALILANCGRRAHQDQDEKKKYGTMHDRVPPFHFE